MDSLSALREAYELAGTYVGCGDNSCVFVKPKGMATNGRCRCIEYARPGVHSSLGHVYRRLREYLADVEADPFSHAKIAETVETANEPKGDA